MFYCTTIHRLYSTKYVTGRVEGGNDQKGPKQDMSDVVWALLGECFHLFFVFFLYILINVLLYYTQVVLYEMCDRERQDDRCIIFFKTESRLSGRREVFFIVAAFLQNKQKCTFKYSAINNHFHILSKLEEKGLVNAM